MMKMIRDFALLVAMLACATTANAQLVQKKPSAVDSVDLSGGTKKRPLVYSDSASLRNDRAANGATASMDSREYSNDSTMGTVIGIGAEFVGQTIKNMLSPNSAEADAVEREWQKR
ncbi:MAG: hypothetical protein IK012_04740 [Fibrobacter sp.]|uniref:hypothetical protein n=1 Tax=Fibrobacter sp. TaxID=35828 RepID=UPI0025BA5A39|nr:hypothetical protein [Fibrobacter sp.]MBR4784545.1 hypothetical protein [Fibrobacter sp.]